MIELDPQVVTCSLRRRPPPSCLLVLVRCLDHSPNYPSIGKGQAPVGPGHRLGDVSGPVVSSAPSLMEGYGGLDGDGGAGTGVDSAIFQVPCIGKIIPNGPDKFRGLPLSLSDSEGSGGKTQVMGEIKVALKKEVKQEGDQLILEVLQCRNITYKFKSPDHLPDLYVKLYVVNVATQKRIIKKKTRVCRHDREPSFNETFRFSLNPTGHSLQVTLCLFYSGVLFYSDCLLFQQPL
uniref:C2 domain-containing protein n=1 Tax=Hucho hucho TaxID=62062 RepID=A0A4W5L3N0_9TELE